MTEADWADAAYVVPMALLFLALFRPWNIWR